MIIISHRGNIDGPVPNMENRPEYIRYALQLGFHVELDVRYVDGFFRLGHDKPIYKVEPEFFYNDRLFVHCKDVASLYKLVNNPVVNTFYHNNDIVVLTSRNLLWTYPNKDTQLTSKSIAVLPEQIKNTDGQILYWNGLKECYGICTDYANRYKKLFS